jgi:hypothetical protein
MTKIYKGNVSIVTSWSKPKQDVAGFVIEPAEETIRLVKDVDGAFNSENAHEILEKALECSTKEKLKLNTWSFFFPLGIDEKQEKLQTILLSDKFGKPKLTQLPPRTSGSDNANRKSRKLA